MVSGVQKHTAQVQSDLFSVIRDFSQYLKLQKKTGNNAFVISERSNLIIDSWGEKVKVQSPFFFQGSENSDVFILDSTAGFFKGDSGILLVKILAAMDLVPESVFICNAADLKSVHDKISNISPEVIITLGSRAARLLLDSGKSLEACRGRFHDYHGIKLMPTLHPALLLKQPSLKREVWEDMKQVIKFLGSRYES